MGTVFVLVDVLNFIPGSTTDFGRSDTRLPRIQGSGAESSYDT